MCGSQLLELKLSTEGRRRRGSPSNILATQSARLSQQKSQRRRRRTWRQIEKERQRRWRRSRSSWGQQLLRASRIVKVKKDSNLITTRIDTVFWQAIESAIEFIAPPSLSVCTLPFYASVPISLCVFCVNSFDGASIFLRALTESTKMNSINWLDQQEKLLADKCYKCHAQTTPTSHTHTHTQHPCRPLSFPILIFSPLFNIFTGVRQLGASRVPFSPLLFSLSLPLCHSLWLSLSHSAIYSLFAWLHLSCLLWTAL